MLLELPESPRYLLWHNRTAEARLVLAHLTSSTASPEDKLVLDQSAEIEEAIELERRVGENFRWKELWEEGELRNRTRMMLCFGIQLMQQVGWT